MFEISIAEQTMIFLQASVLGIGMGLLYDAFRIIRIKTKNNIIFTFIFDILYTALFTVSMFLFIVDAANGMIHAYIPMGTALGMCLYFLSASRPLVQTGLRLIKFINSLISYVIKFLFKPFLWVYDKIIKKFFKKYLKKGFIFCKK